MVNESSSDLAKVTAAILAGGEGRRLGGLDKGLQPLRGRPLIEWVVRAIESQCERVLICANRNESHYARFGPVLHDDTPGFLGPLSGIATALGQCKSAMLLTVPVDTPMLPADLVRRLRAPTSDAPIRVVHDGVRRQPLFALYSRHLAERARDALARDLAVWRWQDEVGCIEIDFSDVRDAFRNFNTADDFRQGERST